jgi:hypothetical protein
VVSERKSSQLVGIGACINSEVYIWEGRRQTEEPEAEMGESGDDSEPQDLAGMAKDLKISIDNTQFSLQHHLQETHETMHRGQGEIKEAFGKNDSHPREDCTSPHADESW